MKPMSEKPTERGDYCFMSPGGSSVMPTYASFDGENWLGGTFEGCYYFDSPEPFGSENIKYAEPVQDNTLAGRLASYKASK